MAQFTISKKKLFGKLPLVFLILFSVLGLLSTNPALTVASLAVLVIFFKMFWRPGEPPILLFILGYQWLQASILVFYGDWQGLPLQEMDRSQYVNEATWYSLLGLLFVAAGLRLGAGPSYASVSEKLVTSHVSQLSVRRLFYACLFAIVAASVLGTAAYIFRPLSQPILMFSWIHWVVVYIFAYTVLSQKRGYGALLLIFGIEIVIGFLGFFSGFKIILVIFLMAALAAPSALRGVRIRSALALGACILVLGVVWTGIKKEYRDFLNQGTEQQVVLVSVVDRVDKLTELISGLTKEDMQASADTLIHRLTYVHFFGDTIHMVPDKIPYENGKLWTEALQNAFMPRVFFPNKPSIDDSVRTAYYTGKYVAGADDGTSISLGYIAESYIDFGPFLMAVPLVLWGYFIGRIFRLLVRSTKYPIFGYGCATVLLFLGASFLEQSNVKMLGGMLLGVVVFYFAQKYIAARFLRRVALPVRYHPAAT